MDDAPCHDADTARLEADFMRRALDLARRATGDTVPNPLVGAVLVLAGRVLGEGWHRRAGQPHAEVEALRDAAARGEDVRGATLYVTLEPCCTHGRTPPCTEAILRAGIRRVVVATTDPNPAHAGKGLDILRRSGVIVDVGRMADRSAAMNAGFNHWIVHRTPRVTLKAGMSLDGKIATRTGESRWITSERSRAAAMRLRLQHDAILVGIGTVLADDPSLTIRLRGRPRCPVRVILDSRGRMPPGARMLADAFASRTIVVATHAAPQVRLRRLRSRATVWMAPADAAGRVDLRWLMGELGRLPVTSVLVEGGGEVHGAFLEAGLAHAIRFFYGPLVVGGREARPAVGGAGFQSLATLPRLSQIRWQRLGDDWNVAADIENPAPPAAAT
jgi:diaminohydroxyphosphoribosylaminopyrimidine deaminase/5-amino-6-(5-phosphoribosylamino)uracil reductase